MGIIAARTWKMATGACVVRSAEASDAVGVLSLMHATATETDGLGLAPDEVQLSEADEVAVLEHFRAAETSVFAIAELSGQIVGAAWLTGSSLQRARHAAQLGIGVRRAHFRKGIGRALMNAVLAWADAQGLVRVSLEVLAHNHGAIALYEASGFEREGMLRAFRVEDGAHVSGVLMARVLPASPTR